jgi:membrane fusion protein (multidrug efflux system)
MQPIHQKDSITAMIPALLLIFLAAGCGPQTPPGTGTSVPRVSVMTVQPREIRLSTELPGRTSAYRIAEIRPQVSGLLQKRLFTEGADVKASQVLYHIDTAPFQAAVDNADANLSAKLKSTDQARAALKASIADVARLRATLKLAETNRGRYETAHDKKAVSTIQRDEAVTEAQAAESTLKAAEAQVESRREAVAVAQATIAQARAELKTARINLGYTNVTAPISGRIGRSGVTEGAIVTAYQSAAMTTIQQLDPVYVDVPQSTTELLRLKQRIKEGRLHQDGTDREEVKLILEDDTNYTQDGSLKFSDVTVDPTTGSVILRMVFPNPDRILLPGMFVRAVINEGVNPQAILIPQQCVSRDHKGNPFALIVDAESKVVLRMITLDRAIGDKWLVSAGLTPGDRVIVEGMLMLRPGTTVNTVPFNESKTVSGPEAESGTPAVPREDGGA